MQRSRPARPARPVIPSTAHAGLMLLVAATAGCAKTGAPAGRPGDKPQAGNLIQNGDFSAGLVHWELSGHGAVVDDPQQPGNPVLRVELAEDVFFGLSQPIALAPGTEPLTLRFRVLATAADESSPIGLRLRIEDASGDSAFDMWRIAQSNTWIEIIEELSGLPPNPVAVTLENNHGTGALLIDDLVLRPAHAAAPGSPRH
jgi:hypothetical protein